MRRWLTPCVLVVLLLAPAAAAAPDAMLRPAVQSVHFLAGTNEFGVAFEVSAPCGLGKAPRAVTLSFWPEGAGQPVVVRRDLPACTPRPQAQRILVPVRAGSITQATFVEEARHGGSWQVVSRFPAEGSQAATLVVAADGWRFALVLAGHLALAGLVALRSWQADAPRRRSGCRA